MKKIKICLTNFSGSISDSLLNVFGNKISSKELLNKPYIIKSMKIGFSFLNDENNKSYLDDLFKGEAKHSSIYLSLESGNNTKAGVIVQYGKYKQKENDLIKQKIQNIDKIGFPYGKKGGLMFAEIDPSKYKEIFCTAGMIHPRIDKKRDVQMTFKNFIDKVKKIKGPWDCDSYDPLDNNCQKFVAAALQVINVDYSPDEDKDDLDNDCIPLVIREELEKHIKK